MTFKEAYTKTTRLHGDILDTANLGKAKGRAEALNKAFKHAEDLLLMLYSVEESK